MPLFRFVCEKCETEVEKIRSEPKLTCEGCGTELEAELPQSVSSMTMETRDVRRGAKLRKNNDRKLLERMRNHHDRYEVEEKIDRYGMDEAQRHGWLKKGKKI